MGYLLSRMSSVKAGAFPPPANLAVDRMRRKKMLVMYEPVWLAVPFLSLERLDANAERGRNERQEILQERT